MEIRDSVRKVATTTFFPFFLQLFFFAISPKTFFSKTAFFDCRTPIYSYAALSSKNYGLRTEAGAECVKIRGFTLKAKAAKDVLNHATMTSMLMARINKEQSQEVELESFTMKINAKRQTVSNKILKKKYRNENLFDKRFLPPPEMRDECVTLLPFGTKHMDFADMKRM